MKSLRARIIVFALAVIAAVLVPLGIVSYRTMIQQFNELADARLVQAARTIDVLAEHAGLGRASTGAPVDVVVWRDPFSDRSVTYRGHAYEVRPAFQYWNRDGRLQLTSDNFQRLALAAAPVGFSDVRLANGRWRVFTVHDAADGDTVRVAERYDSRNGIARALLWERLTPMLVALPILALLVGWAVRRALRPLDALSIDLAARRADESRVIELSDPPRELEPVLKSLNGLVNRVNATLTRERHFAADAAHQLRTPLAAALLNLENASGSESPELRELALRRAHEGLDRLGHLVNQFLDFARWEATELEAAREAIDVEKCVRTELEEAAQLAADKDLELCVAFDTSRAYVLGWEPAVRALVRNLIDNAFRYTPNRGRVEVRVSSGKSGVVLEVSDSGPGIVPEERAAVLQRFRQGRRADMHGSGLGLSIVKRIADLHGAQVELHDSRFESGLCVSVRFAASSSGCSASATAGAADGSRTFA